MKCSNKYSSHTLIVLCSLIIAAVFPLQSYAQIPFGGQIVSNLPLCPATMPGSFMVTVGPPRGGIFMYLPGATFSYTYGPPLHPGQWLLGMAGPIVPCLIFVPWGVQWIGQGSFIMFHGSSL